ncbi:MAG TPA: hypothetical protein V6D05_08000 [Stenomitos sp.]
MFLNGKRHAPAIALIMLLAGCGVAPTQHGLVSSTKVTAASTIPSDSELKQLEARSPDYLVDNAALEPGMQAEGIWPKPPADDLGNFGKVEDTLWRGARPTEKGLQQLKAQGVKTIVNFENDKKVVQAEETWCKANGVTFVSIPLSVITPPKLEKIQQFLSIAKDPAARPLYFHCMQGSDRTGTAAFAYRVTHDGWSYDKAYQEMVSYHFHTYLVGLRGFLLWFAKTQGHSTAALVQ